MLILMTVNGQIIQYEKKDSEDILKRINNAIQNKIECKIYYSKNAEGNYRIYTIQADKEIIYLTRGSLSQEHPKLNTFKNSLKVDTSKPATTLVAEEKATEPLEEVTK
jgi:hypothetical protein